MQGLSAEQFIYHLKDDNFSIPSEAMLGWNDNGSLKYGIFLLGGKQRLNVSQVQYVI